MSDIDTKVKLQEQQATILKYEEEIRNLKIELEDLQLELKECQMRLGCFEADAYSR